MNAKNAVKAIVVTTIDVSTFTGVDDFLPINATGLPESCYYIKLINNSNTDANISYDGVNANDFITDGGKIDIYGSIASTYRSNFAKGTIVYAAGAQQGTGTIYLIGYYLDKS